MEIIKTVSLPSKNSKPSGGWSSDQEMGRVVKINKRNVGSLG